MLGLTIIASVAVGLVLTVGLARAFRAHRFSRILSASATAEPSINDDEPGGTALSGLRLLHTDDDIEAAVDRARKSDLAVTSRLVARILRYDGFSGQDRFWRTLEQSMSEINRRD